MIDLKFLRENPDVVRASQRTRGEDPGLVDVLLEADSTRRAAVLAGDQLRAEQKALGKRVGKASPEDRPALLAGASELAAQVKAAEAKQHEADAALDAAQRALSNIVEDGAPAGGEEDFVLLETVGEIPTFEFEPKDHLELGESLNLIDMERGAKVSGSRFYFMTGYGALLQQGMLQLAAQKAVKNGFTMMIPPVLVRPEIMAGTGFLGAHSDEIYRLAVAKIAQRTRVDREGGVINDVLRCHTFSRRKRSRDLIMIFPIGFSDVINNIVIERAIG